MKSSILLFAASFILFILISAALVQATTGALTETGRSAIRESLSRQQLSSGGIYSYVNSTGGNYANEAGTSMALLTLLDLEQKDAVNVSRAVGYMASRQDRNVGGFGAWYGYDGTLLGFDSETTYLVVHALSELGALNRINRTAALDFVLARYNASTGSFHELPTYAYGREYAVTFFDLRFRADSRTAYANPNVISTYLAVSTLADLSGLNLINATKTMKWILSCEGANGAFGAFPTARNSSLSGEPWLTQLPFDTDRNGTGVPYTFAAVAALKTLGRLDALNGSVRDAIEGYLMLSQSPYGDFYIHPDNPDSQLAYTYYAVATLSDLGLLQKAQAGVSRVISLIQRLQALDVGFQPFWPVRSSSEAYGLFETPIPVEGTFYAVEMLRQTGNLGILDGGTPLALETGLMLFLISALFGLLCIVVIHIQRSFRKGKASD